MVLLLLLFLLEVVHAVFRLQHREFLYERLDGITPALLVKGILVGSYEAAKIDYQCASRDELMGLPLWLILSMRTDQFAVFLRFDCGGSYSEVSYTDDQNNNYYPAILDIPADRLPPLRGLLNKTVKRWPYLLQRILLYCRHREHLGLLGLLDLTSVLARDPFPDLLFWTPRTVRAILGVTAEEAPDVEIEARIREFWYNILILEDETPEAIAQVFQQVYSDMIKTT